jgi:hypothetical protein
MNPEVRLNVNALFLLHRGEGKFYEFVVFRPICSLHSSPNAPATLQNFGVLVRRWGKVDRVALRSAQTDAIWLPQGGRILIEGYRDCIGERVDVIAARKCREHGYAPRKVRAGLHFHDRGEESCKESFWLAWTAKPFLISDFAGHYDEKTGEIIAERIYRNFSGIPGWDAARLAKYLGMALKDATNGEAPQLVREDAAHGPGWGRWESF